MTDKQSSNESPTQESVVGLGGVFEPDNSSKPETDESEAAMMLEAEDDEAANRQQDKERRSEDLAP